MNIKKMVKAIRDHDTDLQGSLFRLITTIGCIGLIIGVILGAISGEDSTNIITMLIALALFMLITFFSIHFHKIQMGAIIVTILIIYIFLPLNFLTSGGIYGGATFWFVFGFVFTCIVVENKIKYVFLASGFVILGVCYYIAYNYPSLITQHTLEMTYIDSVVSLVIVSLLVCVMIIFQNAIFRNENLVAQKQKHEIEELNKAQNRFFSNMSHEIRTPINTIIGLNEMIMRETDSEEVAADAMNIQAASKMLLTLINDILDMSKIESGKMDIVPVSYDTGAMLSDIVNMIWVRAREKGLEFHIDVDQTMPSKLLGDEVRIKQILVNVLNNAVKYTSEGSVTLAIQCKKLEDNHAQISYSVTDTGAGIKKESIPYLFSAFKRVDEKKNRYIEGTGLGLSIVKQLVELMGGDIAVNSVYTKGSTFVVNLPQEIISEEEIGDIDFETRHEMNFRKSYKQSFEAPKAEILIVDDNETNLLVEEKLLRATKVQIDTASSGAECLRKTNENHYDVIFMDHLMPVMDGIECLHAIRAQKGGFNQETPVVILTANAGGENQALYKREGFDGYLLKPVTGSQIEAELLSHLPTELVNMENGQKSVGMLQSPVLEHKRKNVVMISADSVCDLPKSLMNKFQISTVPYWVVTEGGEFQDGVEADADGIISYIKSGKNVYTKPPKVSDYESFFAEQLTKAQYIIHIVMSQKTSDAYPNALEASKIFDNVVVIDSGHVSSGIGLMILKAAEFANNGLPRDIILKEIERMKSNIKTSFIVDSTEYLLKSGKFSSKINTICKSFMLHPVIVLKKSSMKVGSIRVGTRDFVWNKYIEAIIEHAKNIDNKILFITYAGLTNEELKGIEELVRQKVDFENIYYQKASSAIATNCGPGCFGLFFMTKTEKIY